MEMQPIGSPLQPASKVDAPLTDVEDAPAAARALPRCGAKCVAFGAGAAFVTFAAVELLVWMPSASSSSKRLPPTTMYFASSHPANFSSDLICWDRFDMLGDVGLRVERLSSTRAEGGVLRCRTT